MVNCSAVNCSNRSEKNFRMFRFPKEKLRRKIWINNCRRDKWEPTESARLCEIHFEKSQFELNRQDNIIKLKPNAIPTVFNIPNPPQRIDSMAVDTCRSKTAVRRICSEIINSLPPAKKLCFREEPARICSEIINSPPPTKKLCVREEPAVAGEIILPSHSRDFDPRQPFQSSSTLAAFYLNQYKVLVQQNNEFLGRIKELFETMVKDKDAYEKEIAVADVKLQKLSNQLQKFLSND